MTAPDKSAALARVFAAYVVALYAGGVTLYWAGSGSLSAIFIADLIATAVIFLFSRHFRNSSFYDAYWSVIPPFIALYWLVTGSAATPPLREMLVLGLILYWSTRLTLNWAIHWEGLQHEDWRYAMLRERSPKMALLTDQ